MIYTSRLLINYEVIETNKMAKSEVEKLSQHLALLRLELYNI